MAIAGKFQSADRLETTCLPVLLIAKLHRRRQVAEDVGHTWPR